MPGSLRDKADIAYWRIRDGHPDDASWRDLRRAVMSDDWRTALEAALCLGDCAPKHDEAFRILLDAVPVNGNAVSLFLRGAARERDIPVLLDLAHCPLHRPFIMRTLQEGMLSDEIGAAVEALARPRAASAAARGLRFADAGAIDVYRALIIDALAEVIPQCVLTVNMAYLIRRLGPDALVLRDVVEMHGIQNPRSEKVCRRALELMDKMR